MPVSVQIGGNMISFSIMNIFSGITYNLRGLKLGVTTPRLLMLGLIRFFVVSLVTIISAGVVLLYHQEIMNLLWSRPESRWIIWLWHIVSWLLTLILIGSASIISYLVAQLLFAVIIMDAMSRITEAMTSGEVMGSGDASYFSQLIFLVKQEIPRAVLPVLLLLALTFIGWFTPAGPILTVVASTVAALFLAWDNTDLVPARRLRPFKERFAFFMKTLPFHLGFGILFLVPIFNILSLSFAPVGATLYFLEKQPQS